MTLIGTRPAWLLFAAIAAAVVAVEFVVAGRMPTTGGATPVAAAVTADLVVGLPAVAWLLLVRRGASAAVAVAVALGGLLFAHALIVPRYDGPATVGLVVLELAALMYAAVHVRRVVRAYARLRPTTVYAYDALTAAVGGTGRAVDALLTELTVLGLALGAWRRQYTAPPGAAAFSGHRRNGYTGILTMMMSAVVVETVAVHLLVSRWRPGVAWVLTGLSVLTALWIAGHYHAVRLNPHVLHDGVLHVRCGLQWRADIALDEVRDIRRYRAADAGDVLGMQTVGDPDVVVELHHPVTVRGMYGTRHEAHLLGISVDDVTGLQRELRDRTV